MKNAIISESETGDIQKLLDKIQENNANERAVADFRKLSQFKKYSECVRYGKTISDTEMRTCEGYLLIKVMEIYNRKFAFILICGGVTDCYELQ